MNLRDFLNARIGEHERRLRSLRLQFRIDVGYANSSDAEPSEVEFYRFQAEIERAEISCVSEMLSIMRRWLAVAEADGFQALVPPGEAP